MIELLLTLALVCPLGTAPSPTANACCPQGADDKPLKALEAWEKMYHAGRIPIALKDARNYPGPQAISLKFDLVGKGAVADPTWAGDLEAVLAAVARLDSAAAARALLDIAAIGLDQGKYTVLMAPHEVRAAGERALLRLPSGAAREEIAKAARAELKVDKERLKAVQAAALRILGQLKDGSQRATIQQCLGDGDPIVRIHAAQALAALGDDKSALELVRLLEREQSDPVLVATAQALRNLYRGQLPEPGAKAPTDGGAPGGGKEPAAGDDKAAAAAPAMLESVRLAVKAAIGALGRTSWRADMELLRLLGDFRSPEAVPALIGVLERFQSKPEDLKSGKLSGLLLYQAHELLVSMTGAVHPADQPEKWRAFWEQEKDKITVTVDKSPKGGATVGGGFCGIPVQGTRIVFVLDLSGSMDWPMDEKDQTGKSSKMIRLDFAKRELNRAMDVIAPNAQFNLVTFNGDDKAEAWSKEFVPATEKNRDRFRKHVAQLKARGGTNLWSGIEHALNIKSQTYGSRYATAADEVFILSDGAPSVGEIIDPIEILRLVQECNRFAGVRINTVFINSPPPPDQPQIEREMSIKPEELMRRMAAQNGGVFREL